MNKCSTQKQLIALTKVQLINMYGINVYKNIKDTKEKKKKLLLGLAYVILIIALMGYVGIMSYGYVYIGLGDILPAYLIMMASIIILCFSVFKAGDTIFQKNSYDIISSLPLKSSTIVISRFIRLYVESIILTLVVMLPAMVVYGILRKTSWTFYIIGLITTFFIPIIPITVSVFVGTLITALSARAKHKNIVSILLSVVLIVGVMIGSLSLSGIEENIDIEHLQNILNKVLDMIKKVYPPAVWLGKAMLTGDFILCLACLCGGFLVFTIVISLVSVNFKWINNGLYSTNAKHDYKMETLGTSYLLGALYKREFKRYFSSSVYVVNTIISPIMAMLFSIALLITSPEEVEGIVRDFCMQSGIEVQIRNVFPMALATLFSMMPISAVSISMEGKQWWIAKTLPIKTKDLLNSKLLMSLSVMGPFYIISVIFISIGQRLGIVEIMWTIIVPLLSMLFSCVFAQTVNLKLPVFNWETEVAVVKQSASMFIGGLLPCFVMLVLALGVIIIPVEYYNISMFAFCIIVSVLTFWLYRKNAKINLINILFFW